MWLVSLYEWRLTSAKGENLPTSPCCLFPTKTNMADESSDEELNVQNGYDGEIDIYLAGDSGSDTSESAGNVTA